MTVCHDITFLAKNYFIENFGFIEPKNVMVVGRVGRCQQKRHNVLKKKIEIVEWFF